MSQINVNTPEPVSTSGDRTAAAGINLITVLVVLGVLAVVAWYLFTGPLHSMSGPSDTTVNVNTPPSTINVNPPSAPAAPAPANNTNTGTTTNNNAPAPAKP
jgi:cytoskeletal protein RodZ